MNKYKSFYVTKSDIKMLEFLQKKYGCNQSAVIRRLLIEAYALENDKKESKN